VPFPPGYVTSIYFDDLDLLSVKDNLSGVYDRRNLRLRYYLAELFYIKG
jgi:hypothetical protein